MTKELFLELEQKNLRRLNFLAADVYCMTLSVDLKARQLGNQKCAMPSLSAQSADWFNFQFPTSPIAFLSGSSSNQSDDIFIFYGPQRDETRCGW